MNFWEFLSGSPFLAFFSLFIICATLESVSRIWRK